MDSSSEGSGRPLKMGTSKLYSALVSKKPVKTSSSMCSSEPTQLSSRLAASDGVPRKFQSEFYALPISSACSRVTSVKSPVESVEWSVKRDSTVHPAGSVALRIPENNSIVSDSSFVSPVEIRLPDDCSISTWQDIRVSLKNDDSSQENIVEYNSVKHEPVDVISFSDINTNYVVSLQSSASESNSSFSYKDTSESSPVNGSHHINRLPSLRRTVSDQGSYCSSAYDSSPLDLSVDKSARPWRNSTNSVPETNKLLELADAVVYLIENDKDANDAFYGHRSSPSNSLGSVSSHSQTDLDEKPIFDEYSDSSSHSAILGNYEDSVNFTGCESFHPDGIILNSNVEGERLYAHNGHYLTHDNYLQPSLSIVEEEAMLNEVANLSVTEGLPEGYNGINRYEYNRIALMRRNVSPRSMLKPHSSLLMDSKKRFRLAKHQYEKMSDEDRRVRHRVLDNQRSKQYRERRRKMVTSLQQEILNLEDQNSSLRRTFCKLQRQVDVIKEILIYTRTGCTSSTTTDSFKHFCVKSECS